MTNWLTYEFGHFNQDLLAPDPTPVWHSEGTVDLDPNKVFAIADDNSLTNLKPKCCVIYLPDVKFVIPKSRDQVRQEVISARDD